MIKRMSPCARFLKTFLLLALVLAVSAMVPMAGSAATFTSEKVSFTFDNDLEEFFVPFFMTEQVKAEHVDGAVKLTMLTDARPPIIQRAIEPTIDGTKLKWLYLRVKYEGMGSASIFSFSSKSKGLGENLGIDDSSQKIIFAISKEDTDYVEYWVDLSKNAKWASTNDVDMIRISVGADWASPDGFDTYIDKLELYANKPAGTTAPPVQTTADNKTTAAVPPTTGNESGNGTTDTAQTGDTDVTADTTVDDGQETTGDSAAISTGTASASYTDTAVEPGGGSGWVKVLIVIGAVVLVGGAGVGAFLIFKKHTRTAE